MRLINISRILLALLTFVSIHASAQPSETVRIGAILPLSGNAASWGNAFKNGMEMALEELPPEVKSKIEITFEDDGLTSKNTISSFQKMMATRGVDLVVNLSSGTAKALAPVTEKAKVPLLAVASDAAIGRGRTYAFNYWVTPEEEVKAMLPELSRRNYRRIARVNTLHEGVLAVKEVFDRETKGKIEILLNDDFPPETKDFKPFLSRLRPLQGQIDAVMVVLMPGQLGVFARQFKQSGIELPLFGFETVEDANEVALSEGALLGTWYVNAFDGDGSFLTRFKERFPGASTYLAPSGYDAVQLVAAAIKSGTPRADLHRFFSSLKDFKGAQGTFSATGDQRFSLPATLKIVTKDGFSTL